MNARHTLLIALAAVIIFAAGVVTGGLLVHKTNPRPAPPGGGMPFLGRVDAINRAAQQVSLTTDQQRRVGELVRNAREQIADYFMILEPDIQHVFRDLRQQIQAELSPAQRAEFEEILRKRQQLRPGDRRLNDPPRNAPAPSLPPR